MKKEQVSLAESLGIQEVLVVDEDLNSVTNIRSRLRSIGCRVISTFSAGDAAEKMRGQKFNLVVFGEKIQDSSGKSFADHVKSAAPDCLGIPLSKAKTENAGGLAKYFSVDDLVQVIQHIRSQ